MRLAQLPGRIRAIRIMHGVFGEFYCTSILMYSVVYFDLLVAMK